MWTGDVLRQQRCDGRQLFRGCGAKAVRRDAEIPVRGCGVTGERRDEICIRVDRMHEPPLPRRRRRTAKVGMGVEHRQQREPDSGRAGGGGDAARELRRIGVWLSLRIVMHVVEFGDCGVARLQHLQIGLRGDRLERVGVDTVEECIHRLPPRPEAVAVRARAPGASRDRALEGVRMEVGHPRHERAGHALGALRVPAASTRSIVPSRAISTTTSRCQPRGVNASAAKSLIGIRCRRRAPRRRTRADGRRSTLRRRMSSRRRGAHVLRPADEGPIPEQCTRAHLSPRRTRGTARARIASPNRERRRPVLARGRGGTSR